MTKEIGLEILVDQSGWIKSYDFFASEDYFIEYLRTKDLCNEGTFQTLDITNVIILWIQSLPLAPFELLQVIYSHLLIVISLHASESVVDLLLPSLRSYLTNSNQSLCTVN